MLERRFLKFTDESEQQRDKLKTWQHNLEDNLLKLANQNKADATILELQYKSDPRNMEPWFRNQNTGNYRTA